MSKNIIYYSGIFWPKNPYFEYNLIEYLQKINKDWNIKLCLDKNDIRLTNINQKETLISFSNKYKNVIEIEKYDDLKKLTKNIDLLIGSNLIIDRRKMPLSDLRKYINCKILIIDLFGYDIAKKNVFDFSDYIFVKGDIFKEWLIKDKYDSKNIYVTGSPYFDYYKKNKFINFDLEKKDFIKKYSLKNKPIICLTTTNLSSSRITMNEQNLEEIIKFYKKFKEKYNFIIISYPNDYLFYEIKKKYRRSKIKEEEPDYSFIQKKMPESIVIECQDNINSLKYSDKIFHLSVGALSSEILYYFNKISFTMNFVDKDFYLNKVGYSDHIRFPDDICNINLKNIFDLDKENNINIEKLKNKLKIYFKEGNCHENISNTINKILN